MGIFTSPRSRLLVLIKSGHARTVLSTLLAILLALKTLSSCYLFFYSCKSPLLSTCYVPNALLRDGRKSVFKTMRAKRRNMSKVVDSKEHDINTLCLTSPQNHTEIFSFQKDAQLFGHPQIIIPNYFFKSMGPEFAPKPWSSCYAFVNPCFGLDQRCFSSSGNELACGMKLLYGEIQLKKKDASAPQRTVFSDFDVSFMHLIHYGCITAFTRGTDLLK